MQRHATRVDHQVVAVGFAPFLAGVVLIMGDAAFVGTLYFRFRLRLRHSVFVYATGAGALVIGIAEHFDEVGAVFQHVIGAPAHYHARLFRGYLLNDFAFRHEKDIVRRKALPQRHPVVLRKDVLQPERREGLLVRYHILLVDSALFRRQTNQFLVVQPYPQLVGYHFPQQMPAAPVLAGNGDNDVF